MTANVWSVIEVLDADKRCVFTAQPLLAELRKPENVNRKIAVLNVVGSDREGMSFLLMSAFRRLKCTLPDVDWTQIAPPSTRHKFAIGCNPETEGIDVWPELLPFKNFNGDEFLVLLADTQGTFDYSNEEQSCASIFGIASMLASVLVFNTKGPMPGNDLSGLAHFAQFAGKALCGEQKTETPLQHLMFLMRNCTQETKFGFQAGEEYLHYLKRDAPFVAQTAWSVLNRSYAKKSAFCITPSNQFDGVWSDYSSKSEQVVHHIRELVQGVLESLQPKTIGGHALTCGEFAVMIQTLAQTFRSGNLPKSEDVYELLVKSQLDAVVTQLVDEFTPTVREKCTSRSDFNSSFRVLSAAALRRFEQAPKWGDESHRKAAQKKLQDQLIAVFNENTK